MLRAGFGLFYGPGQFEDRIQPIENYIERRRVQLADVPNNGLQYPVPPSQLANLLSIRGYTHHYPNEYNMQYGVSLSRELPGEVNLTVGYTGSQGKDMFLRGVGNTLNINTRARLQPTFGQIDYKTAGCVDGLTISGYPVSGCGYASYDALQISATRRFRAGFTGGVQYQYSRNKGTTQGSNEAATTQNTFDYESEYGTNPQDIPHTFNGSLVYLIPGDGLLDGRLARRRHRQRAERRADQRRDRRPDNATVTARPSPISPAATAAARSGRTSCLAWIRT